MNNQTNDKDDIIKRILHTQEIMDSKDILKIKEYVGLVTGGDVAALDQINAMSDADIMMFANTVAGTHVTEDQLRSSDTTFDIGENEAVVTIKKGPETNTLTVRKFNGQW